MSKSLFSPNAHTDPAIPFHIDSFTENRPLFLSTQTDTVKAVTERKSLGCCDELIAPPKRVLLGWE